MTVSTKNVAGTTVLTVPNQLTVARLVLSIVLFALLPFEFYLTGLAVFIVAASTDWLDGYLARRYGWVTVLGRILDPFVDKIIICGTFIFLAAVPASATPPGSQVQAWMVVVIVGRELLVTALRSFLEQQGADFSATMSGKLKMVVQCIAAGSSLFYLSNDYPPVAADAIKWLVISSVWAAVALTIYSGVAYVRAAITLLRG
jgi:CDP-diacylglycerol---glycerol-3-phosphate 3-phosphatidyltransferase